MRIILLIIDFFTRYFFMADNNSEKTEGKLAFDIAGGRFWIVVDGMETIQLGFGDTFEVKDGDGNWVETGIEITSDADNNLLFKLKNTNYAGILDDLEVRK